MFEKLKGMFAQLGQLQSLLGLADHLRAELAAKRLTAASASGAVRIEITGDGKVLGVRIAEELVQQADRDTLEREVCEAITSLLCQQKELLQQTMMGAVSRLMETSR